MDAATFINPRPWVRSRIDPFETEKHPDEERPHFSDPDKPAAKSFDTFGAFLNYVNMMILPILCFIFRQLPAPWLYSLLVFDVWMAIDMAMNLAGHRPFYDRRNSRLVVERKAIIRNYLRTRFPVDLLSSLPYELVALALSPTGVVSPFWRLRCVVRFYRVARVLQRLEDSFELQGYIAITRLLLLLFLLVHWSCNRFAGIASDNVMFVC